MAIRIGLLVVVLFAGCTAIRPLDAVDVDAARGLDASGLGDAGTLDADGLDAAPSNDANRDAFTVDTGAAPIDAGTDAGIDSATDAAVVPDTNCPPEVCGGGDEDCDGVVDEAGALGSMSYYPDVDLDSYGNDAMMMMLCLAPTTGRWVMRGGDCDDMNRQVNPGRGENCNGRDDDCNGLIDDGLTGCSTTCTARTYGGHTYQFCGGVRTQADAATACGPLGHLANIGDAAENMFVQMQAASLGLGTGGLAQGIWIGLVQDPVVPTTYRWTDGTAASYFAWDATEPNSSGTCIRMRSTSGLWADGPCTMTFPFVCETP